MDPMLFAVQHIYDEEMDKAESITKNRTLLCPMIFLGVVAYIFFDDG